MFVSSGNGIPLNIGRDEHLVFMMAIAMDFCVKSDQTYHIRDITACRGRGDYRTTGLWKVASEAAPPTPGRSMSMRDLAARRHLGRHHRHTHTVGACGTHPRPPPDSGSQQPHRATPTVECSHGHLMAVGALTAAASLSVCPAWAPLKAVHMPPSGQLHPAPRLRHPPRRTIPHAAWAGGRHTRCRGRRAAGKAH